MKLDKNEREQEKALYTALTGMYSGIYELRHFGQNDNDFTTG